MEHDIVCPHCGKTIYLDIEIENETNVYVSRPEDVESDVKRYKELSKLQRWNKIAEKTHIKTTENN